MRIQDENMQCARTLERERADEEERARARKCVCTTVSQNSKSLGGADCNGVRPPLGLCTEIRHTLPHASEGDCREQDPCLHKLLMLGLSTEVDWELHAGRSALQMRSMRMVDR